MDPNIITKYAHNMPDQKKYTELFRSDVGAKSPVIITLDDIKKELKYQEGSNVVTANLHRGQRKLFLSELEFLTNWFLENPDSKEYVVYAGAAPGNKTHYLSRLFPAAKFILIDPAPFNLFIGQKNISHRNIKHPDIVHIQIGSGGDIKRRPYNGNFHTVASPLEAYKYVVSQSNYKIFIIEDYMTEELAAAFAPLDSLFISDVRSKSGDTEDMPFEVDVCWNLAMQFIWITRFKSKRFMIKFRQPFYSNQSIDIFLAAAGKEPYITDFRRAQQLGIDFIENFQNKKFIYFKGEFFIQCFAPYKSTETRLVGTSSGGIISYDFNEYESKLCYFNNINRTLMMHENKYADKSLGFDYCNDCAKEAYLWERYLRLRNIDPNTSVKKFVRHLSQIAKSLYDQNIPHGHLFSTIDNDYLIQVYEKYIAEYNRRKQNQFKVNKY
jgi:hypothetical protein